MPPATCHKLPGSGAIKFRTHNRSIARAAVGCIAAPNILQLPMTVFTLTLDAVGELTDEAFYQLCRANPEVKVAPQRLVGEAVLPDFTLELARIFG